MPRLLILASEFPPGPGGIGSHAYYLARHLGRLGWYVAVVTVQDYVSSKEVQDFNAQQDFPIVRLRSVPVAPLKLLLRAGIIAQQIRKQRPHVLLATGERAVWATAALKGHVPAIAVGHGTEFGLGGWYKKLNQWAFGRVDHVVCVSRFTWQMMAQQGIVPQQSSVIPNGADDELFREVSRSEIEELKGRLGLRNSPLILTVGNVTERKGQHVIIRALPHILREVPDVHYLIAGLPTMKEQYSDLASSLGVANHVHFLGRVPQAELPLLMNACDVFAMTSVNTTSGDVEGYGIAAVEAALCGKPAVVSDGSGLAEAVLDKVTGLVVPQNDPEQTAKALVTLLKDDVLRQRMGMAARERALAEQTWSARAKTYDELFRRLIS